MCTLSTLTLHARYPYVNRKLLEPTGTTWENLVANHIFPGKQWTVSFCREFIGLQWLNLLILQWLR